jgi:DNA repair exonuclease SbcCD ATPase subunit
MIFKKLMVENFLSFKKEIIELERQGFVAVLGENKTDETAVSNGSGKSSWVEALVWALTGETIRGISNVQNRYTTGDCRVVLLFEYMGNEFIIERVKAKSLTLLKNNVDISGKGIRDTQDLIKSLFPMANMQFISATTVLGQGMPFRFTNNKPAGRKEELEKLTQADFQIEDLKNKLTQLRVAKTEDLRAIEDKMLSAQTTVNLLSSQNSGLNIEKDSLADGDILVEQISNIEKGLLEARERIDKIRACIDICNNKISQQNNLLLTTIKEDNNRKQELLQKKQLELDKILEERQASGESRVAVIQQIKHIKEAISKDIETDCPNCGHHFHLQKDADTLKASLDKLEKEVEWWDKDIYSLDSTASIIRKEQAQIMADTNGEIEVLQKKCNESQKEKDSVVEIYDEEERLIQKDVLESMRLKNILENLENNKKRILLQLEKNNTNIKELNTVMLPKLNSQKTGLLLVLADINKLYSFATKEFRGILLSDTIQLIDKKAKELAMSIFNTTEISIELDGTNIDIKYGGKELESLSGGERQAVDIVIQLALRSALLSLRGETSNILVCDEILDNLDGGRATKVIGLISILGLETVYFITHHGDDLQLPYDKQLLVIKENNVSRIEKI